MFEVIVSFANRPHTDSTRYVVTHVDDTIHQANVVDYVTGKRTIAVMDARDCTESLIEIVSLNDGIVRIECDVETASSCAVALYLAVDVERFVACVERGGVASEEHVINLMRTVWRDARVPVTIAPPDEVDTPGDCPALWNPAWTPFPHQTRTVAWMASMERSFPLRLTYSGNLRITDGWYIDTECERITRDPSPREAILRGGICANRPGSGKTAIALRLIAEQTPHVAPPCRYASCATLIVLPLNLISQWMQEIQRFLAPEVRVCKILGVQDLRDRQMQHLCHDYDIVITTFYFLRSCRGYTDMVDSALGGRPRTRASLSAWSRQLNHCEPVLEAVHWRRIIVDEIHDTFDRPRDMRVLALFTSCALWGLTGTPVLETEQAQTLYTLLEREKAHHPNLLNCIMTNALRCDGNVHTASTSQCHLRRILMSEEERLHMMSATNVEEEVRLTSFVDGMVDGMSSVTLQEQFQRRRTQTRQTIATRLESYRRVVEILQGTLTSLEQEALHSAAAQEAYESARRDIDRHQRLCVADEERLAALDELTVRHDTRLASMGVCTACHINQCNTIPPCGHVVCPECRQDTNVCTVCGACTLTHRDVRGIGTKMRHVGELIESLAHESVILFVQWKSMMRGIRGYLRSVGIRVLHLDGNSRHREAILTEFQRGGVLVLCMEESFSGLHLPHVRTIVFAHAIVGDSDTVSRLERQAIARCLRQGQQHNVNVVSFVVADSEEEHLWNETHPTQDVGA